MDLNDTINSTTTSTSKTSTTNKNTSYSQNYSLRNIQQGWECPRCGRINAPWVQHCDCSRSYYYPTWTLDHIYVGDTPGWWEQITSSSDTFRIHPESDPIYTTVGGSDYWNPWTKTYENVPNYITNKVDSNIKVETYTYPPNCHTPHYTTETCPNNICENH